MSSDIAAFDVNDLSHTGYLKSQAQFEQHVREAWLTLWQLKHYCAKRWGCRVANAGLTPELFVVSREPVTPEEVEKHAGWANSSHRNWLPKGRRGRAEAYQAQLIQGLEYLRQGAANRLSLVAVIELSHQLVQLEELYVGPSSCCDFFVGHIRLLVSPDVGKSAVHHEAPNER
ncbi:hypothetical protein [Stutzerimonas stutzeri]|jgi:hypothetical protein|uniref:hypothetical protein n=1 Tax=Stutzerimonas stutzeri TaxID=316 RepID=UPI001F1AC1BE|nr:hypothetical protein [Stutzerimonas stutzeri]MBU2118713.1 hypothetical protein [Alphaproteobacteria bacterium]